jgi:RNA polymerase sigma factor (sigma-70 family)
MSTADRTRDRPAEAPPLMSAPADADAFADLLRPHLTTIAHVARRFAPAGEADDVAQEAMLAAWRYRAGFDPGRGTFRAWLLAIVMAESRRAGGHRWRRRQVVADLTARAGRERTAVPGPEGDPATAALERAVASLSRRQREVVGLHYYVDLPVDEIAAVLGLATGTVKSTLADARDRIRRRLSREES